MEDVGNVAAAVGVVAAVVGMLSVRPPWLGAQPAVDLQPGSGHADQID